MDYINNGTLDNYIKQNWPLDQDEVKYIGAQIALALEFMHSKGICHRDLKPQNILLDDRLSIRICDFGEAKQFGKIDREKIKKDYASFAKKYSILNSHVFMTPRQQKLMSQS